ncbi:MAG: methanogenesis marker protein Mmp4/MtxX [Methanosarcinaceae archaeon]|nr:methanogenesis marker protein Mmp4/MtxX [Methanosarcinaceae archaeon]
MSSRNTGNLLDIIEKRALANRAKVAIGIRNPNEKILMSAKAAQDAGYADVVLVGNKQEIEVIGTDLEIIDTDEPEKTIGDVLASGYVDAAVRGTARASDALSHLKKVLGMKKLHRLALLLDNNGNPFFLAPVGIDEGSDNDDKIEFIRLGVDHIRRFGIEPVVGILSGGRIGDIGRDEWVDRTISNAEFVTARAKEMGIIVNNYNILIEDAIKEANFIIAPDGISGNLIFRTLVFLGGGDGMGAPVLMDDFVFVDTSRVGGHYTKAIMLASALVDVNKLKNKNSG